MQNQLSGFHFVGIGGIGMAALAELMHARGHLVTGSDLRATPTTAHLQSLGVRVTFGHDAGLVGDVEAVVCSSAIAEDNVELEAARRKGKTIMSRGALLASVMHEKRGIAISGSHGKTTSSAMTAHLLTEAGLDPTALIGGRVPRPDGSSSPTRLGGSDLLVAEVDESDGSFLLTQPEIAVVTNVDPEHLDHYGTHEALEDAFVDFANRVPATGVTILGIDHPGLARISSRISSNRLCYGFDPGADLRVESIEPDSEGQRARARWKGDASFEFRVPMPGEHNVLNALAAIAVGIQLGLPISVLSQGIESFPGVARRFENKGEAAGIRFVDDYAHHPAEVAAVLAAARSVHQGRIVTIFQPHRFSRTRDCWDDFLSCFGEADRVIISEIYDAGEPPLDGIDGASLAAAIGHSNANFDPNDDVKRNARRKVAEVSFGGSLEALEITLPRTLKEGDLVLTLGAGDVVRLGPRLRDAVAATAGEEP